MHASNFKDISGQKFGRLTAIECVGKNRANYAMWRCRCDCGKETTVASNSLRSGNTRSCGCLSVDLSTSRIVSRNTTHGKTHTVLFRRWTGMHTRCENERAVNYKDYGGRGISVCNEWAAFIPFYEWAMANGYEPRLTLDRIDPNGDYCPDNCRWIPASEQAKNRRSTRYITFGGERMCLADWARKYHVDPTTLQGRSDKEIARKLSEYARRCM